MSGGVTRSTTPDHDSTSSSYPLPSPSWWDQAGAVDVIPVKRPREEDDNEDNKRRRSASPGTTISYLPNRLGPLDETNPHAYLAGAEYAPNRFGDIGDYMRKKEIKVQTQNRDIALASAIPDLPQIFQSLSFYINGNTTPPMEELRKMILQRGGEVRPVLRSKGMVKYIIAPVLTNSKFKEFANYKVVKEGWIVESCKEGKLLDWTRWKLQVRGGWEEGSKKGMEGFLKASGSTQAKSQILESGREESSPILEGAAVDTSAPVKEVKKATEAIPTIINAAPSEIINPAQRLAASSQSLLSPIRTKAIAVSRPSEEPTKAAVTGTTPGKTPAPEGFQWYHSTEPNKDAARLMKDSEWRTKNTAERGNEGGFIDGYYQNSRLHHLSTWKAELKVLVATAQAQSESNAMAKPSSQPISNLSFSTSVLPKAAPIPTATTTQKYIFHVDFDAFFLSCGLATRPHLKGIPAVVCHASAGRQEGSTSEIASASYEARAKGVKNGMSLGRARELVGEELALIPYEFETYKKFSLAFYTILMGYADDLQAVSVDEALIDATGAVAAREIAPEEATEADEAEENGGKVHKKPRDYAVEVAEKIRDDVRAETGCEVSIGISHNILLAKLATRRAKPAGVFHLLEAGIFELLAPLTVEDLPSIGHSTAKKIEEGLGTTNCGELLEQPKGAFKRLLGPKTGDMLWGYLRGMDERKLERDKERKSISAEMNYGIRFRNNEHAEICVRDLAAEVSKRMKQVGAKGRLVTLKLMKRHPEAPIEPPKFLGHGWCETFNKSAPIGNKGGSPTDDALILGNESVKLLRLMRLDPVELRGVGIQVTKLEGAEKKEPEREVGQGTLQFNSKTPARPITTRGASPDPQTAVNVELKEQIEREKSPDVTMIDSSPPAPIQKVITKRKRSATPPQPLAGPSRLPEASSEGIDPDYLAALPPEFQRMAKEQHAMTRARLVSEAPSIPKESVEQDTRAATISPAKNKGRHAAAHITKQLRPMIKTSLNTSLIAELPLYSAWSKVGRQEIINVADEEEDVKVGKYHMSELKDYGIDVDYFSALPEEDQKYVMEDERRKNKQRKILHKPADHSRIRAKDRHRADSRMSSMSPSKGSRGGSLPPISRITIPKPVKPSLFNKSDLPEVLDIVTKWIDSRGHAGPASRDAGKVKTFLKKCMAAEAGFGGLEMAVEVMKLMRGLLREKWGEQEHGSDGEESVTGRQWWDTWSVFKDELDQISLKRFGASLRL